MAGSNSASLSCARPGIPIKLEGRIPATEDAVDLVLTTQSATRKIDDSDFDLRITQRRIANSGIFHMTIVARFEGGPTLALRSVPGTMRGTSRYGESHATFDALLTGVSRVTAPNMQPRSVKAEPHGTVRLNCRYDYST